MAGGLAGQVLGVGIGGAVAASHGWRTAFNAIGIAGLVLALAYGWCVRDARISVNEGEERVKFSWAGLKPLFAGATLNCAYIASGLQLFVAGTLPAWLPTYFVRYYHLPLAKAAGVAAIFLAIGGAGMILCGVASDRLVKTMPAMMMLNSIAAAMTPPSDWLPRTKVTPTPMRIAIVTPFSSATLSSRPTARQRFEPVSWLVAMARTVTASVWVPALPPTPATIGISAASTAMRAIESSKKRITVVATRAVRRLAEIGRASCRERV